MLAKCIARSHSMQKQVSLHVEFIISISTICCFVLLYADCNKVFYLLLYLCILVHVLDVSLRDLLLHLCEMLQILSVYNLRRDVNAEMSRTRTTCGRKYVRGAPVLSFSRPEDGGRGE